LTTKEMSIAEIFQALDEVAVFCPIPQVIHPLGAAELDAHGARWSVDQGLCEPDSRASRMNIGLLTAAGTPHLTDAAAKAFVCYSYWAFLWDDYLDSRVHQLGDLTILTGEVNRVLFEPDAALIPDNVWLGSLRQVRLMFEDCLPPAALVTLRAENLRWLGGELWKRGLQLRATPPTVGEYLRMRWAKAGLDALAAFGGAGAGYTLSEAERCDPLVRAFTQAVFYPCTFVNDMVSLAKEIPLGQAKLNIVSVLAREHRIGLAQALAKVLELSERIVCLMLRLQQRLLRDPRPSVARYARELPQWLPATIHFTITSARYLEVTTTETTPETTLAIPTMSIVDTPTLVNPDDLSPPPYPDVAWWWDQLS
jgi:hypothetical protein